MKIRDLLDKLDSINETTTAGCVAPVSQPLGKKRKGVYGENDELEETEMKTVPGRDGWEIIDEYNGIILGNSVIDYDDNRKQHYQIFRKADIEEFEWNGKTYKQQRYIEDKKLSKLFDELLTKNGGSHSYAKWQDVDRAWEEIKGMTNG